MVVIEFTRKEFLEKVFDYEQYKEWKYQSDKPCVIDFYSDSCPPCHAVSPIVEKLAGEYNGTVIFYKVDTDIEKDLMMELGIKNLPTLVFCPLNDKPVVIQGMATEEKLKSTIEKELL